MKIKKAKGTKKYIVKRKLKFWDYKNCSEAAQIESIKNRLEINKTDVDSCEEFIKNNKLLLKQQRFKSERHSGFTEEINEIALSSDDDKGIQSIDLIETYAREASKDLVCKKEEINCNNINQYKNFV